ncbi:MAG: ComEC/Rec2 family competence protein, partial [Clostridia bacterium]|nr:ComEC/Rec2 family competence protein [Clostridia bacterium]
MKRIFTLIGFSFLFALFVCVSLDYKILSYMLIACVILCVTFAAFIKKYKSFKMLFTVFLTISVAFIGYLINYSVNITVLDQLKGEDLYITGTVCEPVYKNYGKYYYIIQTDDIQDKEDIKQVKIRVSASQYLGLEPFDKISCRVSLSDSLPDDRGFSSSNYLKSQGIYLTGFMYEYEQIKIERTENKPFYYNIFLLRQNIKDAFYENIPDKYAGIICAVLLGDKNSLDEETTNDFRNIGLSHILCVSGLHLSFAASFIFALLKALRLRRKYSAFLTALFVLCFMIITGFTSSVIRAGIMSVIYYVGLGIDKKSDSLNSLGFAVFVSCLVNPFAGANIGLILSSFATLGIIVIQPRLYNFFSMKVYKPKMAVSKFILESVCVTVSATILTIPFTVSVFKEISLMTVIANILIVPAAMIMLIAAFLFIIFYFINLSVIFYPLLYIASLISMYILNTADLLASASFAVLNVSNEYFIFAVLSAFVLFAVSYAIYGFKSNIKVISLLTLIIFLTGILTYSIKTNDTISLVVLQTNKGCSVVLKKENQNAVICCGGNSYTEHKLENLLKSEPMSKLDCLLISDTNKAVSYSAQKVITKFNPKLILLNSKSYVDDKLSRSLHNKNNISYYENKTRCKLWGEVEVLVNSEDENPYIILKIKDTSCLIIPSGGAVPEELYGYYDFILMSQPSENLDKINAQYYILSGDDD